MDIMKMNTDIPSCKLVKKKKKNIFGRLVEYFEFILVFYFQKMFNMMGIGIRGVDGTMSSQEARSSSASI